ncbi:unnamed protein product [Heterobilharzia americana]|nr:unnamed protein product [Heterobilharzia americana]
MPKSSQLCVPGFAGHPWLSDASKRFLEIARRCTILDKDPDEIPCVIESVEQMGEKDRTLHKEVIHQMLNGFFNDLLLNPKCQPNWSNESINMDCIDFTEYQLELMKHFHCTNESILFNIMESLQKILQSIQHTSTAQQSSSLLYLFLFAFFVSYVKYYQKIPAKSFVSSIFELCKDPVTDHIFYDSLIPAVLEIPNHHQSEYILNFLKNSSLPSDCYILLCKLCSPDCNWPTDSYPVLEHLFHSVFMHSLSSSDLSTSKLFVKIRTNFTQNFKRI